MGGIGVYFAIRRWGNRTQGSPALTGPRCVQRARQQGSHGVGCLNCGQDQFSQCSPRSFRVAGRHPARIVHPKRRARNAAQAVRCVGLAGRPTCVAHRCSWVHHREDFAMEFRDRRTGRPRVWRREFRDVCHRARAKCRVHERAPDHRGAARA